MCPKLEVGVAGGRDRFPLGNLRTSFREGLARNLCPGCPCRLARWMALGGDEASGQSSSCTPQGLSESPPTRGIGTSVLSDHSGSPDAPGDRSCSWSLERERVTQSPTRSGSWTKRGWARTGMWGKMVLRAN